MNKPPSTSKPSTTTQATRIRTNVRAGAGYINHGLRIRRANNLGHFWSGCDLESMNKPTPTSKPSTTTRIRTNVRAGGIDVNHGLRVRTNVRAGGSKINHGLRVRA
jgi:hypothetical protein